MDNKKNKNIYYQSDDIEKIFNEKVELIYNDINETVDKIVKYIGSEIRDHTCFISPFAILSIVADSVLTSIRSNLDGFYKDILEKNNIENESYNTYDADEVDSYYIEITRFIKNNYDFLNFIRSGFCDYMLEKIIEENKDD